MLLYDHRWNTHTCKIEQMVCHSNDIDKTPFAVYNDLNWNERKAASRCSRISKEGK